MCAIHGKIHGWTDRQTAWISDHASQEQTLGGKQRPSVMNPLNMFYIVLGTIRAKNKKNWLGNIAFIAWY